ncbi:RusA family crossover junction endodeoxyribonuclease [Bacillus infantis]|uniref:RusA family crossover junction endodeoxyribonuclease n=1 Tax=Bacillus infantis TaxID=324767 RepID=UPI003CF028B8
MNEYKVVIEGRFPSMNEFISANRTHVQKGNKMKRESQEAISWHLLQQHRKLHIDKPVKLMYTFYEPNKKRDLDNISGYFHKVFQDSLVYCGIIPNDTWQYITGFSDEFLIDSKNPRIEVIIQEVGD